MTVALLASALPVVDINLFVHNGATTVAAAIDSVRAQTWPAWRLTLIDDGSTDGTAEILRAYAAADPAIQIKRNRCRTGAVGAFQRGLWLGDADFVMPKSADDLIAPNFISRLMDQLLADPGCVMAHAGALSFSGAGQVDFEYPAAHRITATESDPLQRVAQVMRHYTSSPSFWGIYRRSAVDQLAPIACRAGWDHVLVAELALYGRIRHVPEILYWRRGTGRPVRDLARAATAELARDIDLSADFADALWCTPCITTAFAHIENFTIARLPVSWRSALIRSAGAIFTARWRPFMLAELAAARRQIDAVVASARGADFASRQLAHLQLTRLITAISLLLPDADLSHARHTIRDLVEEPAPCLV
jgi:glycosyltransferase involved in cell wall biosynthesis